MDEEAERLVRRLWRRADVGWTVAADMTGGAIEVVALTRNDVPMVLLRLDAGDVLVEMALPDVQARELEAELQGVVAWVAAKALKPGELAYIERRVKEELAKCDRGTFPRMKRPNG